MAVTQPFLTRTLGWPNADGARALLSREISAGKREAADLAALLPPFRVAPDALAALADPAIEARARTLSLDEFKSGLSHRLTGYAARIAPGRSRGLAALHARADELLAAACRGVVVAGHRTGADDAALLADAEALGLGRDDTSAALSKAVFEEALARLSALAADGEFSPDDDAQIAALFDGLHVAGGWPQPVAERVEALRATWRARHGPLKAIESPVGLKRGEIALAKAVAEAHQSRTRTRRVGFAGPSVRLRVMKGVYYRAGAYDVGAQTAEVDQLVGTGDLVVTTKRLIFASPQKALSPAIDSLLKVETIDGRGIRVTLSSGKPITFMLQSADPHFVDLLERARRGETT
ncbi:MAG: hypothetical protein ACHP7N_00330 [Caulobacterales bacterium]